MGYGWGRTEKEWRKEKQRGTWAKMRGTRGFVEKVREKDIGLGEEIWEAVETW